MKNLKKPSCPNCQSTNITLTKKIESENTNNPSEEIIKINPIEYECTCLDCHHTFKLNYGYSKSFIFANPLPINKTKTLNLLAIYQTDSPFEKNYKIISAESDNNKVYLVLMDDEKLPILLSNESFNEIITDPPKILSLSNQNKES